MNIFFLSGLPRSGSTVLGAILGQNPDFTVTPTSPFLDLICYTNQIINTINNQYTFDFPVVSKNVYQSLYDGFYKNIKTKYIIDKHRGHPRNIIPWRQFIGIDPKIICTVRPIADVLSSYLKLIDENTKDNFVDKFLKENNKQTTVANRAKCLWEEYVSDPYESMTVGLTKHRECLHVVEYDKLVTEPHKVFDGIYKFLGIEPFSHNISAIENVCAEDKDAAWGAENLHTIRPVLGKTSTPAHQILGSYLTDFYNQYNLTY